MLAHTVHARHLELAAGLVALGLEAGASLLPLSVFRQDAAQLAHVAGVQALTPCAVHSSAAASHAANRAAARCPHTTRIPLVCARSVAAPPLGKGGG